MICNVVECHHHCVCHFYYHILCSWSFSSDHTQCCGVCHHHRCHHHIMLCSWSFSSRSHTVLWSISSLLLSSLSLLSLSSPYCVVSLIFQFRRWCIVRWSTAAPVKWTTWRLASSACWWMNYDTSTRQTAQLPFPAPFCPARRVELDPVEGGNEKVGVCRS